MILTDILGGLLKPVKDIVSEVVVDKDKRDQINLELAKLEDEARARLDNLTLQQIETNKVEASHGSVFVAGWRPFVGWVGGFGLAYSAILQPLMSWVARIAGYAGEFPAIDNQLLLYILGGMLGLGGMRTYEKVKGVSTNTMTDVPGRIQEVPKEEMTVTAEEPRKKKKFKIF
jgi:hypothetical protein